MSDTADPLERPDAGERSTNTVPPVHAAMAYEHHSHPPLSPALFRKRVLLHVATATGFITGSLAVGMLGYQALGGMDTVDAFYNASMILGGMGPVGELKNDGAKIFAGLYALYSGLAVLAAAGVIFAPFLHRIMHKLHWKDSEP